ncbi:GAF domain-containing protein [Sphaerisporangium aureirubrum]|uniref:GAF domain-containing protein n=1 Tax=Sphaerisporangium aureirubrum TaxID=1544736 RepID=A0ABW1NL81_9ACTN
MPRDRRDRPVRPRQHQRHRVDLELRRVVLHHHQGHLFPWTSRSSLQGVHIQGGTPTQMGIGAWAGYPIAPEGQVLGTVCVVDTVPRALSDEELRTLATLARAATGEIALRDAVSQMNSRMPDLRATSEQAKGAGPQPAGQPAAAASGHPAGIGHGPLHRAHHFSPPRCSGSSTAP